MVRLGKIRTWIFLVLIVLLLEGCRGKGNGAYGRTAGGSTSEASENFSFLEGGEEGAASWKDNKVDELHAVIRSPVKRVTAEGERDGGSVSEFLDDGGFVRFKNHVYDSYKDSWSGVNGISSGGTEFSVRLEIDPDHAGIPIYLLGPRSGKKGYVACYYEFGRSGGVAEYWFYDLDESFQAEKAIQAKLNVSCLLDSVMGDGEGNYHVTYSRSDGKFFYAIISPEGERIFESAVENMPSLNAYGDGLVSLCDADFSGSGQGAGRRFFKGNLASGTLAELEVSKTDAVRKAMQGYVFYAMPISDTELFWCDPAGIFTYDATSGAKTELYGWSNHGMNLSYVYYVAAMSDGGYGVLCDEDGETVYLLLRPTEEREELKSITLAVSPGNRDKYLTLAANFKKRYPEYVVYVKDDYDETSLLTQLGAGKGPTLVDTKLTGFEGLEKLWQPLDGFLEAAGLADVMLPEALEFGKINGVTYGIVRNFWMKTLVISAQGPLDWDYEGYLNALEEFNGAALTYWGIYYPADWRKEYFSLFQVSEKDNYFFDSETGKMIFDTPEFERMLRLSEKALKCPPAEDGKSLREGDALCERVEASMLPQVLRLRRRLEANNERVIGYPTGEGARNLMVADFPIALRVTATDEEKEIAYTFLKDILSKESFSTQLEILNFSVRKDMLELQFEDYQRQVDFKKEIGTYDPSFAPELDEKADAEFFEELIRNSKIQKPFSSGAECIFDEEFGAYLNGEIDGKMLGDHLKNRLWIYLEENK